MRYGMGKRVESESGFILHLYIQPWGAEDRGGVGKKERERRIVRVRVRKRERKMESITTALSGYGSIRE